jgi:hypothetical protein
MTPFVQALSDSRYRIHFACRDEHNRSRGAWTEVETRDGGLTVVRTAPTPSLDLGRLGAFDDCGAIPMSLLQDEDRILLYYAGWTLGRTVPFVVSIGLAASMDGGETFTRLSEAPVLGRNRHDPFLTGAPWVIKERGQFRMWYLSGPQWVAGAGADAPVHYYTIKHATSDDGVRWETSERFCLPYVDGEHALARPVVMPSKGGYRMLFSARRLGGHYRIHTATSADGLSWEREPLPLLDISPSGWDSEMVCYGSMLTSPHGTFLLYNGNGSGRDGDGVARCESGLSAG